MTVVDFELFIYLLISEIQCCRFEMTALIFYLLSTNLVSKTVVIKLMYSFFFKCMFMCSVLV